MTGIDRDTWAVLWSVKGGYRIHMPKMAPKAMVPDMALALTATFVRLSDDPEFRQEMVEWAKAHKQ